MPKCAGGVGRREKGRGGGGGEGGHVQEDVHGGAAMQK